MIVEEAYVAKVADGVVWLEKKESRAACSGCEQSCVGSIAGGMLGKNPVYLKVASDLQLAPGDTVLIGVEEQAMRAGFVGIYLVPLIFLFAGALLGKYVGGSDSLSALGGLVGMALCFSGLKSFRVFERKGYLPVILRKIQ